jgi:uncharacterized protein YjbJ (UPF0337 family)
LPSQAAELAQNHPMTFVQRLTKTITGIARRAPPYRFLRYMRLALHFQRLSRRLLQLPLSGGCARRTSGGKPGLTKEIEMDWNIVEGNWKQFKGKVKQQWGKLTDDHLDVIAGKRDQLAGKIQESYGITKDEAEKQIKDFEERNKDDRV